MTTSFPQLFYLDQLAVITMMLVGFIGLVVSSFAYRYLHGDILYRRFFVLLALLVSSLLTMLAADHLLLLLLAWGTSNYLFVNLMVHKKSWRAARASGSLALKNFAMGFVLVGIAFFLLYRALGETSIQAIIHSNKHFAGESTILILFLLGAMAQSAIWPFHRWLTSSLNSPTPVSALMHAGLVNGGGFLLTRFAPLYFKNPNFLIIIFSVGMVTALLGTFWKLMQHDVKRSLACSTMGQMGFMLVQCGLGLFPAAVAHLCCHGLFKGYLFLTSSTVKEEKRLDISESPTLPYFAFALTCGVLGSYAFALTSYNRVIKMDTTLVLVVVAFTSCSQFGLNLLQCSSLKKLPLALLASILLGAFYGLNVHFIEAFLKPMNVMQPQPLLAIHLIGIVLLLCSWLGVLFACSPGRQRKLPNWMLRFYVLALNASQPHPSTITTHRNHYSYL